MTASAISGEKSTPERRASRRKLSSTSQIKRERDDTRRAFLGRWLRRREEERKIMSSKVSLLRALRRQKKEGERKARGERRRPIVARTSSLRRFFRRHGVVHVPYVCFCEDKWRKKFFWSTNSQKPKAIVYPPQDEEEHGLSTKDGHERVQSIDLQRGPRGVRSQKKRKKIKEKGPRKTLEF